MGIDWQAALDRLHHSEVSDAKRWGMSDEQAGLLRDIVAARVAELEAENARLLGMIDSMSAAANQLVSAARPHCPTDRNLAQAWKRMRGAIPIRLAGSVARPAAPVTTAGEEV